MSPPGAEALARSVLLAPDAIARNAARLVSDPRQRWMLCQPRGVRASFVHEAMAAEAGDPELAAQVWMLRQPRAVRESYIREVLTKPPDRPSR